MSRFWKEYQHRRWMRPNGHLYVRPDAALWQQPNRRLWQARDFSELKYSSDQPRVPGGNHDGGQWTTVSSGGGISIALPASVVGEGDETGEITDFASLGDIDFGVDWSYLAGDIPTGDSPEIPKELPPTARARNIIVRALARSLGRNIWIAVEAGSWVYDHRNEINSFFDTPKSLKELQNGAKTPASGYDIHHIVEQNSGAKDGSEIELINGPENQVRIPRWKHWLINGWYQTPNEDFAGQSPRQYLKGKSWKDRHSVGLYALVKFGVLEP